jgi:hypothetical protein
MPDTARPAADLGFDAGQLKRRHHLLVHIGERSEFFHQPGEKIALNVRPRFLIDKSVEARPARGDHAGRGEAARTGRP